MEFYSNNKKIGDCNLEIIEELLNWYSSEMYYNLEPNSRKALLDSASLFCERVNLAIAHERIVLMLFSQTILHLILSDTSNQNLEDFRTMYNHLLKNK